MDICITMMVRPSGNSRIKIQTLEKEEEGDFLNKAIHGQPLEKQADLNVTQFRWVRESKK